MLVDKACLPPELSRRFIRPAERVQGLSEKTRDLVVVRANQRGTLEKLDRLFEFTLGEMHSAVPVRRLEILGIDLESLVELSSRFVELFCHRQRDGTRDMRFRDLRLQLDRLLAR